MSLRTAAGFLDALRDGREIWLEGERVKDVTAHPRLRGAAMTIAELYAMQHRPDSVHMRRTMAQVSASRRAGSLWNAGLGVMRVRACAARASTTAAGQWPREFTAQPCTKSRYLRPR